MLKKSLLTLAITASGLFTAVNPLVIRYPDDYFQCHPSTKLVTNHKPRAQSYIANWLGNARCGSDVNNGIEINKAIWGNLLPSKDDTVTFISNHTDNSVTITKVGFAS